MLNKFVGITALLLILTGCTAKAQQPPVVAGPVPTVIPLLSENDIGPSTTEPIEQELLQTAAEEETAVPADINPPASPTEGQAVAADDQEGALHEIYLFEDALDANWELVHTDGMTYDLGNPSRWFEIMDETQNIDSGALSIYVKPQQDFGEVYFTVRPNAAQSYPRDQVIGISFWLNGGDNYLDAEALAVTVVGSNIGPSWSAADNPTQANGEGLYSETRLYFLDLNRSIPPNTWVQVVVIFKELLFDPEFDYLTGFYIKNDVEYRDAFYIDNIATIWQTETTQ